MMRLRMRRLLVLLLLVPGIAHADLMTRVLGDGDGGGGGSAAPPDDDLVAWAGAPKSTTLPELLDFAIRQAPALQTAKIDITVAEAHIAETWARHDWTVQARVGATKSGSGVFSGFQVSSQSSFQAGADLLRVLPTGGTVDLHVGTQYQNTDSSVFTSKFWSDDVAASLTQPLLAGYGTMLYNANEAKATLSRDAAVLARRLDALQLVQAVIADYWDLVLAERQIAITEQSLALARERLRVTEVQVKGGKVADAEVPAVQQIIATREEDVLNGELAVLDRSLKLRRTVGLPIGAGELGLRVATDLEARDTHLELGPLVERAYAASPELAQLAKQDRSETIDIEVTENGLLPQLDLALSLGPTGSDPSFTTAAKNLAELKAYQISGSLTFSRSLHQYDVRYRSSGLRAEREKLRVSAFDVRAQLAQAMASAVAQIELAKRRLVLSERAIELAKANIRIETDRFNLGRSTNFDVLNRLEEQRQAELRKAQALVDWHKAESVVQMLTGDLLPMYGIAVQ